MNLKQTSLTNQNATKPAVKVENPFVITALFSGTGYDSECHGELISELGHGLVGSENQKIFRFNGPGCANHKDLTTRVYWEPEPEISLSKRIFNFFRRAQDIIFGHSLNKIAEDAIKEMSKHISAINPQGKGVVINLGGWSRGGIASLLVANGLAKLFPEIQINLSMIDPVAGPHTKIPDLISLAPQIKHVQVFYAQNESRSYMTPVNLKVESAETKLNVIRTPGNHFSLVEPAYASHLREGQNEPKVVWRLFINFFKKNGAKVDETKIQYHERVGTNTITIKPFNKVIQNKSVLDDNQNKYKLLDSLIGFDREEKNQRGKIYNSDNKEIKAQTILSNSKADKLFKKLCPTIYLCLQNPKEFKTDPTEKIQNELENLKKNDCWNTLAWLKTPSKSLIAGRPTFLQAKITNLAKQFPLPTQQKLETDHFTKTSMALINQRTFTNKLGAFNKIDRKHAIKFNNIWGKHNDWHKGLERLVRHYRYHGFLTNRHHKDLCNELLKYLNDPSHKDVSVQDVFDFIMNLMDYKLLQTQKGISNDGLFSQMICYFHLKTGMGMD